MPQLLAQGGQLPGPVSQRRDDTIGRLTVPGEEINSTGTRPAMPTRRQRIERLALDACGLLRIHRRRRQGCTIEVQRIQAQPIFGVKPLLDRLRLTGDRPGTLRQPAPNIEGHRRTAAERDSPSAYT